AGDEPATRGQAAMRGDEIRAHDAIAIQENAVAAARDHDGAIANLGGAKSAVFVPDMLESAAKPVFPSTDHRSGSRARAVIGDADLEIPVVLTRERTQYRIERIFAIIGDDNDGN